MMDFQLQHAQEDWKYFNYFLLSKLNYQKWGAMQQSDSKMMQSTKIQTTAEMSKKNINKFFNVKI